MKTAEWICTSCHTVNRLLVPDRVEEARDRCMSCRTRHTVTSGDRPVRWKAHAE